MFLLRVAYRSLSEVTTYTCDQEGGAQPHSFLLLLLCLRCAMQTAISTVQCLREVLDCHTTWVCLNGLSCRGDQDAMNSVTVRFLLMEKSSRNLICMGSVVFSLLVTFLLPYHLQLMRLIMSASIGIVRQSFLQLKVLFCLWLCSFELFDCIVCGACRFHHSR